MRLLGYFAGACVAFALLQAAVKLAVLLVMVGALAAFIRHPRQTLALVVTLGVLHLVAMYPAASVTIVGALAAAKQISRWRASGVNPNGRAPEPKRIIGDKKGEGA